MRLDVSDSTCSSKLSETFSSDDEDLEVRLYSELYFEPNPDYVPLPSAKQTLRICQEELTTVNSSYSLVANTGGKSSCVNGPNNEQQSFLLPAQVSHIPSTNNQNMPKAVQTIIQSAETINTDLPCSPDQFTVSFNDPPVINRPHQPRHRLLSSGSVHSIPGSVVLDGLYCLPDSPIPEADESVEVCDVQQSAYEKVGDWHCNGDASKRSDVKKRKSGDMHNDEFYFDLNSSSMKKKKSSPDLTINDTNRNTKHNKSNSLKKLSNLSKTSNDHVKDTGTLKDFIHSFQRHIKAVKSTKKPSSKLEQTGNVSRQVSPIQFTVDTSGESDIESVPQNSSILLTNFSMNRTYETTCNSTLDRVYGDSENRAGKTNLQQLSSKRKKKKQRVWPMDFTVGRDKINRVPPIPHWTPHMTAFYESDFSDEFDLEELHKSMPSSIVDWELDEEDMPYTVLRRRSNSSARKQHGRYFKGGGSDRCSRCRSYDHTVGQCTKLDHCHLCGDTTHSSREECPYNTCFRCGEGVHIFCEKTTLWSKCDVCNRKGHVMDLCPDIWRRYCYTMASGAAVKSKVISSKVQKVSFSLKWKLENTFSASIEAAGPSKSENSNMEVELEMFETSGQVPILPSTSAPLPSYKLSCFSCGKPGHLGPDCPHRVPNFVVLPYDVVSFVPPTQNLLGKTILAVNEEEEDEEMPGSDYGEKVVCYTPCRAAVLLESGEAGLVIGRNGVVVNTLQRLSRCSLSVKNKDGQDRLWVTGEKVDPVIRAVLCLLGYPTDVTELDSYMEELSNITGNRSYVNKLKRSRSKLMKQVELIKKQEEKREKKLKKKRMEEGLGVKAVKLSSETQSKKTKEGNKKQFGVMSSNNGVICLSDTDQSIYDDEVDADIRNGGRSLKKLHTVRQNGNTVVTDSFQNNTVTRRRLSEELRESGRIISNLSKSGKSFYECDSKYEVLDKVISRKSSDHTGNQAQSTHLTGSENSDYDSSAESSDLDSVLEDYAQNCIVNSDDTGSDRDVDSDDDDDCSLMITGSMLAGLKKSKASRMQSHMMMMPDGRLSMISVIAGKLSELSNIHLNVKSSIREIKKDCVNFNRTRSQQVLTALQEKVKVLGAYVIGTRELGYGAQLVGSLRQKLWSLQNSSVSHLSFSEKKEILRILINIFEVDIDDLEIILELGSMLVKEKLFVRNKKLAYRQKLISTPKFNYSNKKIGKNRAPKTDDSFESYFGQTLKKNNQKQNYISLTKIINHPKAFSTEETDDFNGSFLSRKIGSFTKTPKKLKNTDQLFPCFHGGRELKNNLSNRIEFLNTDLGKAKSPRTPVLLTSNGNATVCNPSKSPSEKVFKAGKKKKKTKFCVRRAAGKNVNSRKKMSKSLRGKNH